MGSAKEFYEEYWAWRSEELNYHVRNVTPRRHLIAHSFIKRALAGHDPNVKTRLLDLACGEGVMGKILAESGDGGRIRRTGVDISAAALKLAAPYYDETHQVDADALETELSDRRFDIIVCLEMIEHVFFPNRVLEACRNLLAPQGRLIVSTPNFAFYGNRIRVLRGEFPDVVHVFSSAEHIHYFTHNSFCRFLHDCGFTTEAFDGTYATPRGFGRLLGARGTHRLFLRRPNLFGKQIVYLAHPTATPVSG